MHNKDKSKVYAADVLNDDVLNMGVANNRRSSVQAKQGRRSTLSDLKAVLNKHDFFRKMGQKQSMRFNLEHHENFATAEQSGFGNLGSVVETADSEVPASKTNAVHKDAGKKKTSLPSVYLEDGSEAHRHARVQQDKGNGQIQIVYEEEEHFKYIIPWDSKFRQVWDVFIVSAVLYLCFKIPVSVAYDGWEFPKTVDYLLDVFFWIDIVLNFRTGFVHNGEHITDPKLIAGHYIHSWFAIDLLASIPFEQIFEGAVEKNTRKSLKLIKWLKIPKLLRLGRLLKYLKRYVKYYMLGVLSLSLFFMIHLIGSLWMSITAPCSHPVTGDNICTWEQIYHLYIASLYVAILMLFNMSDVSTYTSLIDRVQSMAVNNTSLNVDDTSRRLTESADYTSHFWSEWTVVSTVHQDEMLLLYILDSFAVIIGLGIIVNITGEVVSFAINRAGRFNAFYNKVDDLIQEMHTYDLPEELQYRVQRYYDYLWINKKVGIGSLRSGVLHDPDLSMPLRKEIALNLHGPLLTHTAMFKGCSADCLFAIAMKLRSHVYLPGDVIFRKGDVARELYFIRRGVIEVAFGEIDDYYTLKGESASSDSVKLMGHGSFFGELALLTSMPRSCSVLSKTVSELSELSKTDFEACMNEFTELSDDVVNMIATCYPGLEKIVKRYNGNKDRIASNTLEELKKKKTRKDYTLNVSASLASLLIEEEAEPELAGGVGAQFVSKRELERLLQQHNDKLYKNIEIRLNQILGKLE